MARKQEALVNDYAEAQAQFARAKSKDAGRKLASFGRLHLAADGTTFAFYIHDVKVALLTPDNILTIVLPTAELHQRPHVYSAGLHKLVPVRLANVGVKRYRIGHDRAAYASETSTVSRWAYYTKKAPEYFTGIKFHIVSGFCGNSKPDRIKRIDKDKRKVWVTAMQAWRTGMLIRAKTGVFDAVAAPLRGLVEYGTVHFRNEVEEANTLFAAITNNSTTDDVLRIVVLESFKHRWASHRLGPHPSYRHWKFIVQSLIDQHSLDFRTRMGVFTGEGDA